MAANDHNPTVVGKPMETVGYVSLTAAEGPRDEARPQGSWV